MDIVTLHWDDLELMRLLARHGTAAAAARVLKVDQTTISRRLARMEQGVGTALFDRLERRLVPTQALTAALAALDRMAEAATLAGNALSSERSRLTSTVTLSAVDPLATWILAPCMGALAASRPDLAIELRQENRNVSLARREADIALRLGRPDHDEALTRRLATIRYCLAGPVDAADQPLPLAAYTEDMDMLPESRWLAERFPNERPRFRASTLRALAEAAAGGCVAVLPRFVVAADPRLAERPMDDDGPSRDLWLLVHPDRRRDAAVMAVVDWIETVVREAIGA